ncbi:MAG: sensor histidine kinase, partial [Lachnospiraceae bacterium]|nr:sensor histidine kinase [Lachnospiraceae bacterium]
MKKGMGNYYERVKERRFALSLFSIYWGILLLMSGIHSGLIVMMEELQWIAPVKSAAPILYWGVAAFGITVYTRKRIKDTYEVPLH